MVIKIALVIFIWLSSISPSNAAEDISFKGTSKSPSGETLTLAGKLLKPQGNGPFPAVVLMHTCDVTLTAHSYSWAEKISSWGYVTLVLDSFTPRGEKDICDRLYAVPFDVLQRRRLVCCLVRVENLAISFNDCKQFRWKSEFGCNIWAERCRFSGVIFGAVGCIVSFLKSSGR